MRDTSTPQSLPLAPSKSVTIASNYVQALDPCSPSGDNVYTILPSLVIQLLAATNCDPRQIDPDYEASHKDPQWCQEVRLRGRLLGWLKLVSLSVPVLPLPPQKPALLTTMDVLKGALNASNPIQSIVSDGQKDERWMQADVKEMEGWIALLTKKSRKRIVKWTVGILMTLLPNDASPPNLMSSILQASMLFILDVPTISPEVHGLITETVNRVISQLESDSTASASTTKGFFSPGSPFTSLYDKGSRVGEVFEVHCKNLMKHVEENEKALIWECRVERMVQRGIDQRVRRFLKELEPSSAKELQRNIDSCKSQLSSIFLPGGTKGDNNDSDVRQAMKDLKRERIYVNGTEVVNRVLSNKRELVDVIKSALKDGVVEEKKRKVRGRERIEESSSDLSFSDVSDIETSENESPYPSSDTSHDDSTDNEVRNRRKPQPKPMCRPRKFDTRKLEQIVARILLAASRTFSGGDMLAVMDDLFGCDGVVIKPSLIQTGTIEINVSVSAVSVVCRMFAEVVDLSLLEEEGTDGVVMYLYGKTEERIELQIVRKEGGGGGGGG